MAESLVLSDGTRSFDLLGDTALIYVRDGGFTLPVVSNENTYAEGSDSEGRSRVRYRATNSEAGSITVYFRGTTNALFRDAIDDLQELVVSANANKGTLAYTPPNGVEVTYDLESIQVTDMPQDGVALKNRHGEATISFEVKPFGRLASERLNVQDTYQEQVTALSPSIFLPLGASAGLTDLSGNARNGTAAGGVTVGGATGPLTVSDGGATDFDGTDDRITTTYATRRNLCTNPNFETDTAGWAVTGTGSIARSTAQFNDGAASVAATCPGAGATLEGVSMNSVTVAPSVAYTGSAYVKATVGTTMQLLLREHNAADGTIAATTTSFTATGGWDRISATATFSALGVKARVAVRTNAAVAITFYVDDVLLEQASSVGTHFPTTAQLASGEAGWLGTANASASDIGCFANGTTRTFMGWAYRDTSSGVDTIFSGSGATPPVLAFSSGSQNIVWKPDNSTTTTWASGISNGTWFHWELEFAEPTASNNASLYINGALISAQTNAGQYSANCGNFQLGALTSTTDPFDGKQAWVSVHQTALTATQIRDCYDAGKAQITLDGPIDSFVVEGVPGQVTSQPAITFEDRSSQSRNIVEVGVQNEYDPNAPENLSLSLASGLTALGGSSNTRASSVSTNIIRAALATTEITVCKAASQTHKGLWKIRARVYPSAATVLVRLAWRTGDGPFAKEKWVAVPGSAAWFDLDLGTINIKELPSGHTCEFRVEAKSTSGSPTVDVDIVECIPADSYTKLRGSTSPETGSGAIVAMDDFSTQTAGAVTGKTPLLAPAGLYSGAGDADDFTVDTATQTIYRTAVSDSALNNGRYLRVGSGTLALTVLTADIYIPSAWSSLNRYGVFLRYTDTSNWLAAVYSAAASGAGTVNGYLHLIKRVAGTETVLASPSVGVAISSWRSLYVAADASGNVVVTERLRGSSGSSHGAYILADSSLATAGALASGGYGFFDANTDSSATTRYYDNFQVSTLATSATVVTPAMNANYGVTLKHNTSYTDNATGTNLAVTPIRQGNYPKIPPATRNGLKSRVVVRARRDDNDLGLADSGVSDTMTASLTVTPRVHLTGS
jgi:hypothetical protein